MEKEKEKCNPRVLCASHRWPVEILHPTLDSYQLTRRAFKSGDNRGLLLLIRQGITLRDNGLVKECAKRLIYSSHLPREKNKFPIPVFRTILEILRIENAPIFKFERLFRQMLERFKLSEFDRLKYSDSVLELCYAHMMFGNYKEAHSILASFSNQKIGRNNSIFHGIYGLLSFWMWILERAVEIKILNTPTYEDLICPGVLIVKQENANLDIGKSGTLLRTAQRELLIALQLDSTDCCRLLDYYLQILILRNKRKKLSIFLQEWLQNHPNSITALQSVCALGVSETKYVTKRLFAESCIRLCYFNPWYGSSFALCLELYRNGSIRAEHLLLVCVNRIEVLPQQSLPISTNDTILHQFSAESGMNNAVLETWELMAQLLEDLHEKIGGVQIPLNFSLQSIDTTTICLKTASSARKCISAQIDDTQLEVLNEFVVYASHGHSEGKQDDLEFVEVSTQNESADISSITQVVKAFIHRAHWWPAYYFTLPSSILEVESFSENAVESTICRLLLMYRAVVCSYLMGQGCIFVCKVVKLFESFGYDADASAMKNKFYPSAMLPWYIRFDPRAEDIVNKSINSKKLKHMNYPNPNPHASLSETIETEETKEIQGCECGSIPSPGFLSGIVSDDEISSDSSEDDYDVQQPKLQKKRGRGRAERARRGTRSQRGRRRHTNQQEDQEASSTQSHQDSQGDQERNDQVDITPNVSRQAAQASRSTRIKRGKRINLQSLRSSSDESNDKMSSSESSNRHQDKTNKSKDILDDKYGDDLDGKSDQSKSDETSAHDSSDESSDSDQNSHQNGNKDSDSIEYSKSEESSESDSTNDNKESSDDSSDKDQRITDSNGEKQSDISSDIEQSDSSHSKISQTSPEESDQVQSSESENKYDSSDDDRGIVGDKVYSRKHGKTIDFESDKEIENSRKRLSRLKAKHGKSDENGPKKKRRI